MTSNETDKEMSERTLLQELTTPKHVAVTEEGDLISSDEMLFMTLASIRVATDEFSDTNKLGQGGFGAVYKVTYIIYKPLKTISVACMVDSALIVFDFGIYIAGCSARW